MLHAGQQRQPALVEQMNRLDCHGMVGCAGHLAHLRCRANVDRQPVIRHRRAVAADDFACRPVQTDHLVAEKTGTSKSGQRIQVNVHVVVAVVARDVTGQHARVGRVGVTADHRQAHAGDGVHAKTSQHPHMAVAAADQHDVAQDRLFT